MPATGNQNFKIIAIILASMAVLNFVFLYAIPKQYLSLEENGLIENLQVVFLFLAMIVFLYNCLVCEVRNLAFFAAVVCLGFCLRELDVELLDVPHIAKLLGSGIGRNILMATLFIISIIFIMKEKKPEDLRRLVSSNFFFIIIISGLFLVSSWVFDKNVFQITNNLIIEEMSEINAYLLILISSFVFYMDFKKK